MLVGGLTAALLAISHSGGGRDTSQDTAFFKSVGGLSSETEFVSHTRPATDGQLLD
jgi:hypothetical protein